MGSAIVSIGLLLDGDTTLSRALLAIAGVTWIAAGVLLVDSGRRGNQRFGPTGNPGTLTLVAGSAVLGSRVVLLGWTGVGAALLSIAAALWLVLIPPVLAGSDGEGAGISLMPTVATQSIAVLVATMALRGGSSWLLGFSVAAFVVGLGFYAIGIARFDVRELASGRGDQWIAGGALGISSLAAAEIVLSAQSIGSPHALIDVVKYASLALWALAIVWLPPLVAAEVVRPRPRYYEERWSTVFPVGMYAACSFAVGGVMSISGIADFARVWIWVALGVWAVVFLAMIRSLVCSLDSTTDDREADV